MDEMVERAAAPAAAPDTVTLTVCREGYFPHELKVVECRAGDLSNLWIKVQTDAFQSVILRQGVRAASFYWVGSEIALPSGQPSIWKKFDSSVPFKNRADSVIAWLQLPEEKRPHLVMWYLEEPDHTGHLCTPDSSATFAMVEKVDSVLGYFFQKARTLDIFDKIDFLVVSDHGMATYTPEESVNLADYLPRDSFHHVFEGVPTLLYPKPGYAEKAYEVLKNVPNVTVWKKDEIPAKHVYGSNPRVPELVVAPNIGTYVVFRQNPDTVRLTEVI